MAQKRVGILRGGKGKSYHASLRRGGDLIACIAENLQGKYKPVDILVDTEGVWHAGGIPVEPAQLIHRVDIVWNTTDPSYGIILSQFSIPVISAPQYLEHELRGKAKVPRKIISPKGAREVHGKFPAPWLIRDGSEARIVKTYAELTEALDGREGVVVEEFIVGSPGAVHCMADFRGEGVYVLPDKNLTKEEKEMATGFARELYGHLAEGKYLKIDFTIHPRLGIYVTNIDFHPDLRANSHLAEHLGLIGGKTHHLVEHILESVWWTHGESDPGLVHAMDA